MKRPDFMPEHTAGFVVPYVLLSILVLSVICLIAANRLTNMSSVFRGLNSATEAELAFASAESQALFALLTARSVDNGFDLSRSHTGLSFAEQLRRGNERNQNDVIKDFWSAAGGRRVAFTDVGPVVIELRDLSGLLSLRNASEEDMSVLLEAMGIGQETAGRMAAALGDYQDDDHRRRFQGAERADYRLRNQQLPANAPLRDYAELERIMHWDRTLNSVQKRTFRSLTTLTSSASLKKQFAAPRLLELYNEKLSGDSKQTDVFAAAMAANYLPSDHVRLTLTYISDEDVIWQRIIEVERRPGSSDKPFRRYLISEEPVTGPVSFNVDELKNVIHTETLQPQ